MLISWWAIDRSSTPNGILNKSKYDSQMLKRREKNTAISKTQRQSPWKYYSERQNSALVFHSLLNWGGWEEVQNVRYHYTVLEWHDEKQQNPLCSCKSAASIGDRQIQIYSWNKIQIHSWNNTEKAGLPLQCISTRKNRAYQRQRLSGETQTLYKVCFGLVECSEHIQISSKMILFFYPLISS